MTATPRFTDDYVAIANLVADSQYMLDAQRWHELTERVFADEISGVIPEADFGFDRWVGTRAIREGFDRSMPRFDGCAHAITNLYVEVDIDVALARYYVLGWHWVAQEARPEPGNVDFLVVGVMTDVLVRQAAGWRVRRRRLERLGPGVAIGALPAFLTGLGTTAGAGG